MKTKIKILLVLVFLTIVFSACSGNAASPDLIIEEYLTALVDGDNAKAVNLSCAAWEESANAEGASFEGVEVSLEEMDCKVVTENSSNATVACEGNIVFSYAGGEDELIPLSRRNYSLAFESGEWRMCGYE